MEVSPQSIEMEFLDINFKKRLESFVQFSTVARTAWRSVHT
jgi:hypothetical protein